MVDIAPALAEQAAPPATDTGGEELLARVLAELNQEGQTPPEQSEPEFMSTQEVMVTRTSINREPSLDTWRFERDLDPDQLDELFDLCASGASVAQMAMRLNIDSKDVVYAVARRVFDCLGDLEDLSGAENNHRNWSTAQRNRAGSLVRQGRPISQIASEYGRTQLAIVWQAIDNGFSPRQ